MLATTRSVLLLNSGPVRYGVSFGNALAIAISWSAHHSVLWAIIHGFFSWVYVLYYVLLGRP